MILFSKVYNSQKLPAVANECGAIKRSVEAGSRALGTQIPKLIASGQGAVLKICVFHIGIFLSLFRNWPRSGLQVPVPVPSNQLPEGEYGSRCLRRRTVAAKHRTTAFAWNSPQLGRNYSGVEPGFAKLSKKTLMLHFRAKILNHVITLGLRYFGGLLVSYPDLHPDRAKRGQIIECRFDNRRNEFRTAEDINHVNRQIGGQVFDAGVNARTEKLFSGAGWIDRYHAVTSQSQIAAYKIARPDRVGGYADEGDAFRVTQYAPKVTVRIIHGLRYISFPKHQHPERLRCRCIFSTVPQGQVGSICSFHPRRSRQSDLRSTNQVC